MANPGYMTIVDQGGEIIAGNCKVLGREDTVEVYAFEHSLEIPVDSHDGSLTGTRRHGNFVVTKAFCPASPMLYKACATGRTLKEIIVSWYQVDEMGDEREYFRHTLEKVRIVGMAPFVPDVKEEATRNVGHRERVSFRYEKIRWLYADGNIESEDTWIMR